MTTLTINFACDYTYTVHTIEGVAPQFSVTEKQNNTAQHVKYTNSFVVPSYSDSGGS